MYLVDKYKIKVSYVCPNSDHTEDQNMIDTDDIDIFIDVVSGLPTVQICGCACCAHSHFIPFKSIIELHSNFIPLEENE
jgi:hypothetical protein